MDRGTVPMLPLSAFQFPPLDVNDSALSPPNNVPVVDSRGFNDMTHTKLIYAAMLCQRRLYEFSSNADSTNWSHWPKMLAALDDFKQHVENDLHRFKDTTGSLAMLHIGSGPKILVSLQLLLRRPPYRPSRNIVPPWDDMDILEAATSVLEEHLKPIPAELVPWAWESWVQWHALAIVLAELLVQPHGSLFDRAYAAARKGFSSYITLIADGDSGMLWKPIARLMHRVQRLRKPPPRKVLPHDAPSNTAISLHYNGTAPSEASGGFQPFPFNTWDFEMDDPGLFTSAADLQSYEQLDNVHATVDTPWLAWDCFLQDLNFPSV